jgi:hypothetical protein
MIVEFNTNPELFSPKDIPLKAPVEFRKYLFNYISGLPGSKSLKQKIPPARDYTSLKGIIDEYFLSLLT